jgi:hypothetical protein
MSANEEGNNMATNLQPYTAPGADLTPITSDHKANNRAYRIDPVRCANENDALVVRFITGGRHGERGVVAIVSADEAKQMVVDGRAESAE